MIHTVKPSKWFNAESPQTATQKWAIGRGRREVKGFPWQHMWNSLRPGGLGTPALWIPDLRMCKGHSCAEIKIKRNTIGHPNISEPWGPTFSDTICWCCYRVLCGYQHKVEVNINTYLSPYWNIKRPLTPIFNLEIFVLFHSFAYISTSDRVLEANITYFLAYNLHQKTEKCA